MKNFHILLLVLPTLFGPGIVSADETTLVVSSSTPDVNIKIRASDRYSIRLPGLQYEFRLELDCAAGYEPDSVLLSVADTRKRFAISEVQTDSGGGLSMKIPASQIAPLSVEGFCLASEDDSKREPERVTVRGVLSAQASLLCSGGEDQQLIYASRSLDVTLSCNLEEAD
jgi:hypothetical protein